MAGASLLTLLDDIATVLDDVALMSKVAAKKTAGVLGDDLALNAQQVSGVAAEREIPVVLAVAKGSLKNKMILVPVALLLSAFLPWLIVPLLVVGGLFLCFEGAEKLFSKWLHLEGGDGDDTSSSSAQSQLLEGQSLEEYERQKVAGAVRTDFILSAEIIVIALGTVQGQSQLTQVLVVSIIAVIMTIGVYGIVAGIVKLDDLGFYLERRSQGKGWQSWLGRGLISFAPKLMKVLAIVGTAAMFLVGGGIIVHHIPLMHHMSDQFVAWLPAIALLKSVMPALVHGIIGVTAGGIIAFIWFLVEKMRRQEKK